MTVTEEGAPRNYEMRVADLSGAVNRSLVFPPLLQAGCIGWNFSLKQATAESSLLTTLWILE